VTEVIQRKYENFKSLVLKLKSHEDSHNDELDECVDEMIVELHSTFQVNLNDLRQRIKQLRPTTDDPCFDQKMFIYSQLLEEFIPIIQLLEQCLIQTLDQFHILVQQIWNEIISNNGIQLEYFIEQHQLTIQTFIQKQVIIYLEQLQFKINSLQK